MRKWNVLLLTGMALLVCENVSLAQNWIADYWRNVPRQYGPRDPWDVGIIMRNQIGWGGHFYNCDCEEHKRLSPYIHWECQPTVCCPHCCCSDIKQQINEVRQRVRTGSCRQSEFQICPRCSTSPPPVRSNCPDQYGGGCPTCGQSSNGAGSYGQSSASPTEPQPADSDNWMSRLYFDK